VIYISNLKKSDKVLFAVVIVSIIITSLVWIGDLASWIYIGNGFTIDVILLVVALAFTGFTIFMRNKMKKSDEPTEEIDQDLKYLQDLEEAEVKMTEETELDKILSCSSCGSLITIQEENCPSCGSAKPVCIVCLSDLKGEEEIVKLSCCSSYAHKEHIDNWVSIKGHCPKCHREIQANQKYLSPV
jgi:hypothetical protein